MEFWYVRKNIKFEFLIFCRPVDDARMLLEAPELLGPCDIGIQGNV